MKLALVALGVLALGCSSGIGYDVNPIKGTNCLEVEKYRWNTSLGSNSETIWTRHFCEAEIEQVPK